MNDDWSFTASKRKEKYCDAPVPIHCKSDQYIIHATLEWHLEWKKKSLHVQQYAHNHKKSIYYLN